MAQILPDDLRPVDTKHPSEGLQTVTNYIHYMRERIEFSLGSMKKAVGSVVDEKVASLDAPNDGKTYGRKDGEWVEVPDDSGGTDNYNDLTNRPLINGSVLAGSVDRTLLKPGDYISTLTNDAGYLTTDTKMNTVVNASETLVFSYTTEPVN